MPAMINTDYDHVYRKYSPILDSLQLWLDDNDHENGQPIMKEQEHDALFGHGIR